MRVSHPVGTRTCHSVTAAGVSQAVAAAGPQEVAIPSSASARSVAVLASRAVAMAAGKPFHWSPFCHSLSRALIWISCEVGPFIARLNGPGLQRKAATWRVSLTPVSEAVPSSVCFRRLPSGDYPSVQGASAGWLHRPRHCQDTTGIPVDAERRRIAPRRCTEHGRCNQQIVCSFLVHTYCLDGLLLPPCYQNIRYRSAEAGTGRDIGLTKPKQNCQKWDTRTSTGTRSAFPQEIGTLHVDKTDLAARRMHRNWHPIIR